METGSPAESARHTITPDHVGSNRTAVPFPETVWRLGWASHGATESPTHHAPWRAVGSIIFGIRYEFASPLVYAEGSQDRTKLVSRGAFQDLLFLGSVALLD